MYLTSNKENTWIGAILLSLFPILAQYSLPIMSFGFVLLLLYFFIKLFDGNGCLYFNKPMLFFVVFALIQQLIVYQWSGTFAKNMNTYFFMVICLFLLISANRINKESFFKAYYFVGLICCTLVIYQFIMGSLFGISQSAIQILPVSAENQHYWMTGKFRASGLFTEPQAFSSFILPLLVKELFDYNYKSAVFIYASILCSTSSQGIILASVVWVVYLLIYQKDILKKILIGIGIIAGVVVGLNILRNVGMFSFAIDKILSISLFSYNIRLTKGFEIYFAMPFKDMFWGIGYLNLTEYLIKGNYSFFWMWMTEERFIGYITTMSNVLVSYGLGGFVFYMNIFVRNCVTTSMKARFILMLILLSSFTQTILFNAWFVFYWIVFELFDNFDTKRYSIINVH